MNARAYVLIEVEAGETGAVLRELRKTPGTRAADVITGPYDIIATIETSDQPAMSRLITETIQRIAGIKHTIACVATRTMTESSGWLS